MSTPNAQFLIIFHRGRGTKPCGTLLPNQAAIPPHPRSRSVLPSSSAGRSPRMFALALATVGLQLPGGLTRRQLIAGAGLSAAGSSVTLPAAALVNPFDPKNAGGPRGLFKSGDIEVPKGPGNTGILMLREAFDGATPSEGLLAWLESRLAPDFEASFAGGTVTFNKEVRRVSNRRPRACAQRAHSTARHVTDSPLRAAQAYIGVTSDLLKSFPDLTFTRSGPIAYNNSPNIVVWN
eukprot:6797662-Prymnesium_polylepis.1